MFAHSEKPDPSLETHLWIPPATQPARGHTLANPGARIPKRIIEELEMSSIKGVPPLPNQIECPNPCHCKDSSTRSGQPFRDRPGVRPALGTPKIAETILRTCRSDDVPVDLAFVNRLHNSLWEPLALSMLSSTLPRDKITKGASDYSINVIQPLLFVEGMLRAPTTFCWRFSSPDS